MARVLGRRASRRVLRDGRLGPLSDFPPHALKGHDMMTSVHLEFADADEAAAFFIAYHAGRKTPGASASAPKTPTAAADHLQKVKEAAAAPAAAAPAPAAAAPTPAAPPPPAAAVTYATYAENGNLLSDTIAKLVAKDQSKAVAILSELGVKRGPLLTAEQWPVAMTKFSAALSAAELA
jgi:hypothetical protein